MVYKYWVSTGLPFKVCSVCLIHYGLRLYLSVSWWRLLVRLCPPTSFFFLHQEVIYLCLLHIHTFTQYNCVFGYSWDCLFVIFVKLCMNACVCYLTSYSVVQLRGLRLPSNTGLYDRARPGASSHPSLPRRVSHGGSRPASPPAQ